MLEIDYFKEFNSALTICDRDGKILYMNDKSKKTFKAEDDSLIGISLFDCHNENSIAMIKNMLENDSSNSYTIEKNGVKKLIYQSPWKEGGSVKGMIELSIEIPENMPHFKRT